MKKRIIYFLVIPAITCICTFCVAFYAGSLVATRNTKLANQAFQYGIETGVLEVTVELNINGSIDEKDIQEIHQLRDEYIKNPTFENGLNWYSKMQTVVNTTE